MKHLKDYETSPLRSADTIIAGGRIYLGFLLLWKGLEFFFNKNIFTQYFDNIGPLWFTPVAALHYVFLIHLFGGICLIAGMGTRLASILQLPILGGAVFLIHLPALMNSTLHTNPAEAYLAIFSLIMLVFFSLRGSGTYSIDYKTIYDEEHIDEVQQTKHGHHA